jgi:hypothetical protein
MGNINAGDNGIATRFKTGNTAGINTRFMPGTSGNQPGISRLQLEYERYQDKLFDDEMRDDAFAALKKAVVMGETWAVLKYLDLVGQAFPKAPIDVNVTADITASRKEYDEQLTYIMGELARYAAGRGTAANIVEAGPGETPLQLAPVGETEPD